MVSGWQQTKFWYPQTNIYVYIVHTINCRSEITRNNLKLRNDAIQTEKDAIDMSQQQTSSWNTLPLQVLDQVISNSTNPSFDDLNTVKTMADPDIPVPSTSSREEAMAPSRSQYSQKMKDLELWNQLLGHCSTAIMNVTRKCSESIPTLPTTHLFFKCLFCKKAKMLKRDGKRKDEDTFIPGQAYHTDLFPQQTFQLKRRTCISE